jgi:all-trans-retinol 13,14-reductase
VGLKGDDRATDAANLWIYPDAGHDANVARFLSDPEAPFPALFISFPSAKDPTFQSRYPGRSTIEVVGPASYDAFARWAGARWKRRGPDYDELKQRISERLLAELERNVPGTRDRVDFAELSTPLSTRHFANYPRGEIYGLSATPARFGIRALGARTPVPNLYLTGQDVCTAGVTGALAGGAVTASAILRRNLVAALFKPAPPGTYTKPPVSNGECWKLSA